MTDRIAATEYRKHVRATMTEAQIQKSIVRHLEKLGIPHSVTDATESFNRNGQRVRRVGRGWPDVTGCIPEGGIFLAIECKSSKGKLSPDQARTLHALYMAGALVVVARSVDDVIEVLQTRKLRRQDLMEICRYKDKLK